MNTSQVPAVLVELVTIALHPGRFSLSERQDAATKILKTYATDEQRQVYEYSLTILRASYNWDFLREILGYALYARQEQQGKR